MIEPTANEENILLFLREARPFEKIIIQKDAQGRPDNYIVIREQKVILTSRVKVINSTP